MTAIYRSAVNLLISKAPAVTRCFCLTRQSGWLDTCLANFCQTHQLKPSVYSTFVICYKKFHGVHFFTKTMLRPNTENKQKKILLSPLKLICIFLTSIGLQGFVELRPLAIDSQYNLRNFVSEKIETQNAT